MVAGEVNLSAPLTRSFRLSGTMQRPKWARGPTSALVLVVFLLSWLLAVADEQEFLEDFLKQEYSLVKPYRGLGFGMASQWDLMGTAMVTPDHVRLTPDLQSRHGAVWSRIPFHLRDWELRVHFKIHGQGKKNFNGDGMALWLTRDRMKNGAVFGSMNNFVGLGIFLDTYANGKSHDRVFPYVSAMVGNGTLSYEHDQDGRPTELGGCATAVRNADHDTFLLVRYSRNTLTLMTDTDGKLEWKSCAVVNGVHLPRGYYFGASSATGDLTDNHDLISMKLYQLTVHRTPEEEELEAAEAELQLPRVDDIEQFRVEVKNEGMGGIQLFFMLLFSVLGLVVLVIVGLMIYTRWKENKRKRFF